MKLYKSILLPSLGLSVLTQPNPFERLPLLVKGLVLGPKSKLKNFQELGYHALQEPNAQAHLSGNSKKTEVTVSGGGRGGPAARYWSNILDDFSVTRPDQFNGLRCSYSSSSRVSTRTKPAPRNDQLGHLQSGKTPNACQNVELFPFSSVNSRRKGCQRIKIQTQSLTRV